MPIISILFLLFQHVQASGGTQWPDRCLKTNTFPCVLYVHQKSHFTLDENKLYLEKGSLLEWTQKNRIVFYKGTAWLKLSDATSVEAPFGAVNASSGAELVLEMQDHRVTTRVVAGQVQVSARGDSQAYSLVAGTEVELGPVDYSRKVSSISLPRAISMNSYLKVIQRVFPFSDLNFQEHIEQVAKSIQSGLRLQSQWNRTIVETKLSDDHRDKVRQKYEAEYAERRDSLLRKIFRQKNNFEDE